MGSILVNIHVLIKDYGWDEPITAYRTEPDTSLLDETEQYIVFCNHAGAEEIEEEVSVFNPNGPDRVWYEHLMACNRCGASKLEGENEWQDAPEDGLR